MRTESKGIVMFQKDYRERDKLVKIFTESAGKLMFLVRNVTRVNSPLKAYIAPFTVGTFIGDFRENGLSYLYDVKSVAPLYNLQQDIFKNAYGTYMVNLLDAAVEDRQYDPKLFAFLLAGLKALDEGVDSEIVSMIFELHLLPYFGTQFNWRDCCVCHTTHGPFDFSSAYGGLLCQKHWPLDPHRYHADPTAVELTRRLAAVDYAHLGKINVKPATKRAIRHLLDEIDDEFIGLHLKSKKFIDQMSRWEDVLKKPSDENPS